MEFQVEDVTNGLLVYIGTGTDYAALYLTNNTVIFR